MNTSIRHPIQRVFCAQIVFATALLLPGFFASAADADLDVRTPELDAQKRFYLYGQSTGTLRLPFIPHGVMPEGADKIVTIDIASKDKPFAEKPDEGASATCAAVTIQWDNALNWCGWAWMAGPDGFWGATSDGIYYDLRKLPKKRLVFYARGAAGGERIQVKVGILGDKKFGDSIKLPVQSRWLALKPEWVRYEVDLSGLPGEQLQRVTNGFTVTVDRTQQAGSPKTTKFFLDAIYFE